MICRVPGIEIEQSGKLFKSNSIGFKTNGAWMFSKNEVLWWLWRVDPFALYNFLPSWSWEMSLPMFWWDSKPAPLPLVPSQFRFLHNTFGKI